jgi:hypothetical protein
MFGSFAGIFDGFFQGVAERFIQWVHERFIASFLFSLFRVESVTPA